MVSKPEIQGQKIIQRILSRDMDHGGVLCQITGSQGSGKTSVLLALMNEVISEHPNEKIFFREQHNAPLQCFKIGRKFIHFLVMEGVGAAFRDRNNHLSHVDLGQVYFKSKEVIDSLVKNKETSEYEPQYKLVPDFEDLWNKAERGKINVVVFDSDYTWMDFMHWLREVGEWVNVFVDEMADICPANPRGMLYQKTIAFASDMGAVRRCMMNVFYNTQTVSDIDWRVRRKAMTQIFLPGAIADKTMSRVTQSAIDGLTKNPKEGNDSWLSMDGEFGRTKFIDIYKPNPKYHIEIHVPPKEDKNA